MTLASTPVQIALTADGCYTIPRAVEGCVRAGANGVSSGASSTKMADITLRWSHDGRLWRCCWSLVVTMVYYY